MIQHITALDSCRSEEVGGLKKAFVTLGTVRCEVRFNLASTLPILDTAYVESCNKKEDRAHQPLE